MAGSDLESLTRMRSTAESLTRCARIPFVLAAVALVLLVGLAAFAFQNHKNVGHQSNLGTAEGIVEFSEIPLVSWQKHPASYLSGWASGFGGDGEWVPLPLAKMACAWNSACGGITCKPDADTMKCSLRRGTQPRSSPNGETTYKKAAAPAGPTSVVTLGCRHNKPPYTPFLAGTVVFEKHSGKAYTQFADGQGGKGICLTEDEARAMCNNDWSCVGVTCPAGGGSCTTMKGSLQDHPGWDSWVLHGRQMR